MGWIDTSHNPYFNRWFSAISENQNFQIFRKSHNPYFNRWFSAIALRYAHSKCEIVSQSLF